MKPLQIITLAIVISLFNKEGIAQKTDTVHITARDINTKVLIEGTHRYLVYFTKGENTPRTNLQIWTRMIDRGDVNGKPAITIKQVWESKDSVMHTTTSVCDAKTFLPKYHELWWSQRGAAKIDFENAKVSFNDKPVSEADTARIPKLIWAGYKSAEGKFFLNWHLDLEVFPTLPFKEGRTFIIPFYDPGTASSLQDAAYTVAGSGKLSGYNGQEIDCWLMTHESKNNRETFWISKKTHEVLKLKQQFGENFRYKVKLEFSE